MIWQMTELFSFLLDDQLNICSLFSVKQGFSQKSKVKEPVNPFVPNNEPSRPRNVIPEPCALLNPAFFPITATFSVEISAFETIS